MGYTPRTVQETAYESERELLRIAKQIQPAPWGLLSVEERFRYSQNLVQSFKNISAEYEA